MKRMSLISFCLSAVLALAMRAGAQLHYKVIDLGTLPGGNISNAYGVNDNGQVVGVSNGSPSVTHAFLWTKSTGMKDLGTFGGNVSWAQAINDSVQIVGQAETNHFTADAFLRKNGIKKDLGSLGGSSSQANAINFDPVTKTFTQIAGWSYISDNSATHAVTWDPSFNILDLGTLGGTSSYAFGNNCKGQVVGTAARLDGSYDAFLWDSAIGMQDLGTLGGSMAQASAINCSGTIVGYSTLAGDAQTDAFVYANFNMSDLGGLGGSFTEANAINNAGLIVGSSRTVGDADTHAVMWTANAGILDLNLFIPANSGWDLQGANSISNNGKIAGAGIIKGQQHAFLLIPE
jgi:probable HAF family extracellular repeat protein